MDMHHRCADAYARDDRLEGPLELTVKMGDVGRRATHVEADYALRARFLSRTNHTDDSAGGSGENRILAVKPAGFHQAAVGLHEEQAHALSQLTGDLIHVLAQHRREICVDHGGVTPPYELDEGADLV